MKVKDVKKGDYLILGERGYRVEAVAATGEVIVELEETRKWDQPRPEGVNQYQQNYGYAWFPMTKLCEQLRTGEFFHSRGISGVEDFLLPVTMTYQVPKGWQKQAVGKETVTIYGYPETNTMCTYRGCLCYVDEYGIRRSANDRAITPNRDGWVRILGHVKPDLDIIPNDKNTYKYRTEWIVLLTPTELTEGLNRFLGVRE